MTQGADTPEPSVLHFGRARFDRTARELQIDDKRVRLGPRAAALLATLLEHRERAVSKHELLDTVWRGVIVEENNIEVQISTLRRLLGPQAIATVPGRGYRFMLQQNGEAQLSSSDGTAEGAAGRASRQDGNLPA